MLVWALLRSSVEESPQPMTAWALLTGSGGLALVIRKGTLTSVRVLLFEGRCICKWRVMENERSDMEKALQRRK